MNPPLPDPVIDEIREIRHRISVLCDHDPAKLVAYFQQIQEQYRDRLITSPRFSPCPVVPRAISNDANNADVVPCEA